MPSTPIEEKTHYEVGQELLLKIIVERETISESTFLFLNNISGKWIYYYISKYASDFCARLGRLANKI